MNYQDFYNDHKNKLVLILLFVLVAGFWTVTDRRVSDVENSFEQAYSPLRAYLPEDAQSKIDALLARWDEFEPTVLSIEDWIEDQGDDTAVTYGYQTLVHGDGPDKLVVESGGELEVKSGGIIDAQTGSLVTFAGTTSFSGGTVTGLTMSGATASGSFTVTGATFDVDVTGAASIDADAASNFNVAGAGIDLTLESEAGSLVFKGDESVATAITLDANEAVTTGVSILVGSVSGLGIDGGLTDIGGGTYATADGDNDLGIEGDLEVNGAADLDGTVNVAGAVTLQGAFYSSFTDLAVSDGDTVTPTFTTYALDSSGNVTITLAATGAEGQLLVLIGDDANDITINDTNVRTNDGGVQVINQYDIIMWVYQDAEWVEISESSNS